MLATQKTAQQQAARTDINARIGMTVRSLRLAHDLTLEGLAERSGVSRSMLSLIERGASSPTAVVLEKLATALGLPLASLFQDFAAPGSPVSRGADRQPWTDPETGYVRWNVSPADHPSPIQVVEVLFPPRTHVAYQTAERDPVVHQQVWVLEGRMEITLGATTHLLRQGDCLAMRLDAPITYRNRTARNARYAVVICTRDRDVPRRGR